MRGSHLPPAARTPQPAQLVMAATAVCSVALSGCSTPVGIRLGSGEAKIIVGPPVRDNRTPMDPALACLATRAGAAKARVPVIAVGEVRDYTGKFSVGEGNAVTQGGSLMVASALGKLAPAVRIAERFDPVIAERELAYTDRRQLGDGQPHELAGATGKQSVPWLPYYGGSIAASDYFIIGGITEVNYDIRSGGMEARVNSAGGKQRTYTQSLAIDLRLVDTRSLLVVRTVSLTKQFTGYETGLGLFRFFGSDLFDLSLGSKGQEPLQLGIRTALEEGVFRLAETVFGFNSDCLGKSGWPQPQPKASRQAPPEVGAAPVPRPEF